MSASNAVMAEALAFWRAACLQKKIHFHVVMIESDAQDIIRSLNSPYMGCA